jgi:general secretion pathway protein G
MKRQSKKSGFTLIEIMLVLALLGLMASFLIPKIAGQGDKGKIQATKILIKQLEGDLDRYRLDCGSYPTSEQTLKALIEAPTAGRKCKNYDPAGYLRAKKLPQDAWQNDFDYKCEDGLNYTITSFGADGVEGGEGPNKDISSSEE